jgi:hypothetical protein
VGCRFRAGFVRHPDERGIDRVHVAILAEGKGSKTMKFMLILWGGTSGEDSPYASFDEEMAAHNAFSESIASKSAEFSGEALEDAKTGRILKREGDSVVVTDGPFADLKENVGGFYIFEAPDIETATEWAKSCPNYAFNELRPVVDFSQVDG